MAQFDNNFFCEPLGKSINLDSSDIDPMKISEMFFDFESNLFILLGTENRVIKMDTLGYKLAEIGGYGSGTGQFNNPAALVSPDQGLNVYILDTYNNRIVRLNSDLKWIDEIDLDRDYNDIAPGWFVDMAVSTTGDFYLSDPDNQRIVILDENGRYQDTFRGRGFILMPGRIELDGEDELYIISEDGHTIYSYDPIANFVDSLSYPEHIECLDIVHRNNFVFAISNEFILAKSAAGLDFRFAMLTPFLDTIPERARMAVTPHNIIWITLIESDRIEAYDPGIH